MTKRSGRSATSRALALLAAFDIEHPSLTLTELAKRAGMPVPTAHRLVGELETWGALQRNTENRYQIGTRLWEVGLLSPIPRRLREIALPFMQDLYEKSKENIHFAVRDGHDTLYIAKLTGHQAVPIISREGSRLPMHSTGVGKALLAGCSDELIETYCARPLGRYTPYTITEPGRLRRELALTRDRGYALTKEEMTLGSCSVAVPVFGAGDEIVAGLGVVVHSVRDNLIKYVPDLKAKAARIRELLIEHRLDPYPGFVQIDLPQGV
ncbi:HTH-type transcriptional regulator KipR [Actinosynnema sp. ALI-1.44]